MHPLESQSYVVDIGYRDVPNTLDVLQTFSTRIKRQLREAGVPVDNRVTVTVVHYNPIVHDSGQMRFLEVVDTAIRDLYNDIGLAPDEADDGLHRNDNENNDFVIVHVDSLQHGEHLHVVQVMYGAYRVIADDIDR